MRLAAWPEPEHAHGTALHPRASTIQNVRRCCQTAALQAWGLQAWAGAADTDGGAGRDARKLGRDPAFRGPGWRLSSAAVFNITGGHAFLTAGGGMFWGGGPRGTAEKARPEKGRERGERGERGEGKRKR